MTYKEIKNNPEVCKLLQKGDKNLEVLGFTEHSMIHCALVAKRAGKILEDLGYSKHDQELRFKENGFEDRRPYYDYLGNWKSR